MISSSIPSYLDIDKHTFCYASGLLYIHTHTFKICVVQNDNLIFELEKLKFIVEETIESKIIP